MSDIKPKFLRKICPKCRGNNVYLDSDEYGWYEHCLLCGYAKDLEVVATENTSPSPISE
jgi:hypothetical protein